MTVKKGLNRIQKPVESLDERLTLIPFSFTINGVTDPDGIDGDYIDTVVRTAAGKFTATLKRIPARCLSGVANVVETADNVDLTTQVDHTDAAVGGTFVVKTKTGTVNTDPADNTVVTGHLLVSGTTRSSRVR